MKIFNGFNETGDPCPICKTHDNKPCILVPIDGTEKDNNIKAEAVHFDCIELRYNREFCLIYQKV